MAYLDNAVLDNGLSALTGISSPVLHICDGTPTSRAEVLTMSIGSKSGISIGSPGAMSPSGRKVTIAAITDGTVSDTDTVVSVAVIDATKLWLVTAVDTPQAMTSGNPFTLEAIDIGIPAPE